MKKALSLVLSLAMLLALIPAFGSTAESGDVTEVEFFTGRSFEGDAGSDLEKDNFVEQYCREHLGVDIKFNYTEDLGTNLNLRLFSGDIPAIMNIPNRNYLNTYVEEEYLENLDEHADALADAFAFTAGNAASGKVNGISYAIAGRPYGYRQAWWYNANAFDAAGITELPTTLDEFVDTIRTVMAADIDGNGVNDTIGLSGADWETLCRIFGCYGCSVPNVLTLDANGDVQDTMLTQAFYDALVYANGLWNEGLIDHEIFSNTGAQVIEKCMTEATAVAYTQWPAIKKVVAWETFLEVDPDARWEIVGDLIGPDGKTNYVGNFADAGYTSLTSIGADIPEDQMHAALKVINFFGTEEGLSMTTYGIEGTHWDYNADGIPTVREDQIKNINFSWIYQFCGREELSYCRVKFGEEAWGYVVTSDEQPRLSDVTSLIDDPEWYNGTDAETYIREECAKFLTGERALNEDEWASFLNELNSTYRYAEFVEYANGFWHSIVG